MAAPRVTPIPRGTIRMTVQVEVPYEHDVMNYGQIARDRIKTYIDKNDYSFLLENGPSVNET
tara:strand:+ start:98 stop:283 length:186 start_codon:yes stop_codon:yes gene_type:complete